MIPAADGFEMELIYLGKDHVSPLISKVNNFF